MSPARSRRNLAKPRVFIGSSSEGLPTLKILAKAIDDLATVVPWSEGSEFKKPGEFFLDSLIEAANNFDISILIFSKDDVVTSRKVTQPAPRDNVVFELGLFMSVLGRQRTVVVAPETWKTKLKVLSDLNGLNLIDYAPPTSKKPLAEVLEPAVEYLRQEIRTLRIRALRRGPTGIVSALAELDTLLGAHATIHTIDNLALDLEVTWRYIHDGILDAEDKRNMSCRALFIDHSSKAIQDLSSKTVSIATAQNREKELVESCNRLASNLKRRKIKFQCRAYSQVPILHGFLIDGKSLFITMCSISNNQLIGSPNPYIHAERQAVPARDVGGAHLLKVFTGWFDYLWSTGRPVWSNSK